MFFWYYDGQSLFIEMKVLPGQKYERIDDQMPEWGF